MLAEEALSRDGRVQSAITHSSPRPASGKVQKHPPQATRERRVGRLHPSFPITLVQPCQQRLPRRFLSWTRAQPGTSLANQPQCPQPASLILEVSQGPFNNCHLGSAPEGGHCPLSHRGKLYSTLHKGKGTTGTCPPSRISEVGMLPRAQFLVSVLLLGPSRALFGAVFGSLIPFWWVACDRHSRDGRAGLSWLL